MCLLHKFAVISDALRYNTFSYNVAALECLLCFSALHALITQF